MDKPNKHDKSDSKKQSSSNSWKVGNAVKKTAILPSTERNHLNPQDEVKVLKNWRFLKNNITIASIVDPLIEKGVYTPDQWMTLKHSDASEGEKVEEFLYHLLKCKADAYGIFTGALTSGGYAHVVGQIEGQKSQDVSPSVSLSSSGNSSQRVTGRPQPLGQTYAYQPSKKQSNSQKYVGSTNKPELSHGGIVQQEDLYQMKEEITNELRQLRQNIEHDRDQDRLELQVLQQKHIEMHEDLATAVADRKHLEDELADVMETVNKLTIKMEEKNAELIEMQEKSLEARQKFEQRSADLKSFVAEKEKDSIQLNKGMQTKEADYKKLQATLESLKGEHEERLGRLKTLNKEKIVLTKEVQTLQRERKNLEVKIKSLEEHIRLLQVKHSKETNNVNEELERQKTLVVDKEKEKEELTKKLEASMVENDNLRQYSQNLENTLQKTEDAKAHLVQKAKENVTKYALPPFTVGRMGWVNRKHTKKP